MHRICADTVLQEDEYYILQIYRHVQKNPGLPLHFIQDPLMLFHKTTPEMRFPELPGNPVIGMVCQLNLAGPKLR